MSVDGRVVLGEITLGHIAAEASAWGLDAEHASDIASQTVEAIIGAVPGSIESADLATAIIGRARLLLP